MNNKDPKFIIITDKIISIIILILTISVGIYLVSLTMLLISNALGYLAFNLNYVAIVICILILAFIFNRLPGRSLKLKTYSDDMGLKRRVFLSIIGFGIIGFLFKYNDYLRVYNDGLYCAEVNINEEYYTMITVEVYDGYINKMFLEDGRKVGESDFNPLEADVDKDGYAYFYDFDDKHYYIELISRGGECQ